MRNFKFDFARAIAIIGIVLCHFFLFGGAGNNFIPLGRYIALVFNVIFFILSALLYGIKWRKKEFNGFKTDSFLFSRLIKLASALYPYLIVIFFLFYIFDIDFSLKDILMNFAFLGWFDKLPGNGHLWFLTMIFMCYVLFCILSKFKPEKFNNTIFWLIIALFSVILQNVVDMKQLPGYLFIILSSCGYIFINADKVIQLIDRINGYFFIPFFALFNLFMIYWIFDGNFETHRTISYQFSILGGLSWVIFLLKYMPDKKFWFISSIASISFEIYIVHHCLCCGPFSLFGHFNSWYLRILSLFTISLPFAYLLNLIGTKLSNKFLCIFFNK